MEWKRKPQLGQHPATESVIFRILNVEGKGGVGGACEILFILDNGGDLGLGVVEREDDEDDADDKHKDAAVTAEEPAVIPLPPTDVVGLLMVLAGERVR